MNCCRFSIAGVALVAVAAGSVVVAQATQPAKDKPTVKAPAAPAAPTAQPGQGQAPSEGQMPPLPPGWTQADMQACTVAGTPGEQHAYLASNIGTWTGKNTMWMAPGTEPTHSPVTATITGMMDGRFTKCDWSGDMPGMGPFNGFALYGYDNVTQKFQATWIDNCSTALMNGTGQLSPDQKTMTWTYSYTCPIRKQVTTMREVCHSTGKDTKTIELYSIDPKTTKEFKMMEVNLTRSPGSQASAAQFNHRTIEAGCAHCVYHVAGVSTCQIAVKMDGKVYLVRGAEEVDADQFCAGPKQVAVSGNLEKDWFVASEFEIQPMKR